MPDISSGPKAVNEGM